MDPSRPYPVSGQPLGPPPSQSNRASKTGGHGANLLANTSGIALGPSQQASSAPRPATVQNHAPEQPRRQGPVLVFKGASTGRGPRVQEHNRTLLRKAASGAPRFVPGAPSAVPPRNYEWIPHKSPAVRPLQADLDEMFASGVVPGAPSTVPPRNYDWIPHKSPAVRPPQADLDEMFASGVVPGAPSAVPPRNYGRIPHKSPAVRPLQADLDEVFASGVVPSAPSAVPPRNYEWIPHKSPAVRPLQADLDEMFASGVVRKRFGDEFNDPLGTRVLSFRGRGSPVTRPTPAHKVMQASRLEGPPRPSRMVAMSSVPRDRTPSDDEDIDASSSESLPAGNTAGFQLARKSLKAASKRDIKIDSDSSPPDSSSGSEIETEGSRISELLAAAQASMSPMFRLRQHGRLPFLMRNLRRGFVHVHKCMNSGAPLDRVVPSIPTTVVYQLDDGPFSSLDKDTETWTGSMRDWNCPLCPLDGVFSNRDILEYHLWRDHSDVKSSWTKTDVDNDVAWTLRLLLPNVDQLESDSEEEDDDDDDDEVEGVIQQQLDLETAVPLTEDEPLLASPNLIVKVKKWRSDSPAPSTSTSSYQRSTTATMSTACSTTITDTRQSSTTILTSSSSRGSLPARYPTPPPQTDPYGPAAQEPYFVAPPDGSVVPYSCRPGEPRLVDLLNTLPLEPFGVLSWQIVAVEEELFELDKIEDKDKVVLALWNRWIMLNRRSFVEGSYDRGAMAFVSEYWLMIHRAAGWGALRGFLFSLMANRYLTMEQMLRVLRHYESHTGMQYWYKDSAETEQQV